MLFICLQHQIKGSDFMEMAVLRPEHLSTYHVLTKQDIHLINQCKGLFPDVQNLLCNHKRIPAENTNPCH